MHNRNEIYKAFEAKVNARILENNQRILDRVTELSLAGQEPLSDTLYREYEGYRNGLVYAKEILRNVIHTAQGQGKGQRKRTEANNAPVQAQATELQDKPYLCIHCDTQMTRAEARGHRCKE